MKKAIFILIAGLMFFGLSKAALAGCGGCCGGAPKAAEESTEAEKKPVINKICPVMGGSVAADTPYTTVHEGRKIGFCCAGCITSFEKDTGKYIGKVEEELKQELEQ